jgi:NAD(P)-dependent dehydrogenase (short-subunit alcohol dehydrogenase family)
MTALGVVDLTGIPALVTGASGGLGGRCARTLAAAGAPVALAARRLDRLEDLAREIEAAGGRAVAVAMDVTDAESVEKGLARAEAALGTVRIVVSGSGVASRGLAVDLDEAGFDAVVATNLKGPWLVSRAAARRMIAAGAPGGSIVNVTSILGERTAPGSAAYCAAKAGLAHLTRCMAVELARHRIRVNALAPGYIATELNQGYLASPAGEAMLKRVPQRRFGDPSDLDGALLLLASDAAGRGITGTTLVVDGGHSVAPA